jgi:hypothetical protein
LPTLAEASASVVEPTGAYVGHHVPYTIWTATCKESKLPTHTGL